MSIRTLNPYVHLGGQSAEAIAHYQETLGATREATITFGDAGMGTAEDANRLVHAVIRIGEGVLMLSDASPRAPGAPAALVSVALDFDDPEDLGARFDALAAGGDVKMPPHDTFYGGRMGVLTDRFGVTWMFNWSPAQG